MFRKNAVALGACMALSDCASLPPNAIVTYYLPAARIHVSVSQTASCGSTNVSTSFKATATSTFSSSGEPRFLRFNDFSGALSDTDVTVNLTSDGRLQGINATNTGEVATTAKGVADLSSSLQKVANAFEVRAITPIKAETPKFNCPDQLLRHGGSATVLYSRDIDFPGDFPKTGIGNQYLLGQEVRYELLPEKNDPNNVARIENHFRKLLVDIKAKTRVHPLFQSDDEQSNGSQECSSSDSSRLPRPYVCLRNTADLTLSVMTIPEKDEGPQEVLAETGFIVPTDQAYAVPLPKPASFGKATMKLTLDSAGGITSIGFAKTSGLAEVLETGAAIGAVAVVAATH